MCLFTKWRMSHITLRPIKCYKLLTVDDFGRVLTPYTHYPVSFDETLSDKVKIKKWVTRDSAQRKDGFAVEKGMFHCFLSMQEAKRTAIGLYELFSDDMGKVPDETFIIAQATVPLFTRYYRGKYRIGESICAKRIRLSSKDTVTVEVPKIPEE